ncbi:flagellar brake protein [Vibrio mediterranei]|uniref:PilZ domain-containing protein n=1 Tax=Vibrio mediterranei TaxID=689 RepID=UPI001EFCADD7|nr:flagellar brake protein [Vibrio mediterranei]
MEWGQQKQYECYRYLKTGMKLSLSVTGEESLKGLPASLIGFKFDNYLVVDAQELEQETICALREKEVIVRGLTDTGYGHVVAFTCQWIADSNVPSKQVYLSPPNNFVTKPIREHSRYKLAIPCSLSLGKAQTEATMVDFSLSGCGIFIASEHDFCKGLEVKIDCELNRFLPAGITFEIASIKKHGVGSLIGIQFNQQVLMSNNLKMTLAEWSLQASH